MLNALRAKTGWARALAFVVLFAFALGLVHAHGPSAVAAPDSAAMVSSHDSHDGHAHGESPVDSVSAHCSFCAVVAGKFFLEPDAVSLRVPRESRVTFVAAGKAWTASARNGLFRPPIAALG